MKKLFALLMALALLGSVAMAEKETFTFDEANPGYEGTWVEDQEAGIRIYLPAGYSSNNTVDGIVPDTMGAIKVYMSEDYKTTFSMSATPMEVESSMIPATMEAMLSMYQQTGDTTASIVSINGMDWIYARNDAMGSLTLIALDGSKTYTVSFVVVVPGENKEELVTLGDKILKSVALIKE